MTREPTKQKIELIKQSRMRLGVTPPLALPNNLQTQQTNVGNMQYTTQMNIIENFDLQLGQIEIIRETFTIYVPFGSKLD